MFSLSIVQDATRHALKSGALQPIDTNTTLLDDDGVRFIVTADGREVFARETIETRWQPQGVDLTEFAGRRVRLTLLTDALRNTSYDWALWGNPRVLVFRNAGLQKSGTNQSGRASATIPAGALAVKTDRAFKLRIVPDSGEPPIELSHPGPLRLQRPGDRRGLLLVGGL